MNEFDDRPLMREPERALVPEVPPPTRKVTPVIIMAAVGLVLGGAAAWWWTRDSGVSSTPQPTAPTEGVIAPATASSRVLPPLGQMDTFLRALIGALSSSPELARWLATDDLIHQMANGIDRMSRGSSPARELPMLNPGGQVVATGRPGQLIVDPRSYHRYDALASLVASLDARAVADAYRTIQPRLDEAYRALGRSESSVDAAIGAALTLLIETPVVRDPVRIVHGKGTSYAYADSELEALTPIQKQLLRMGPDNVERVQARLREIQRAIAVPPGA